MSLASQFLRLSLVIFCSWIVIGCKKKLEDPKLHDPIYKDLSDTLKDFQSALDKEIKNRETIQKDLANSKSRSRERAIALRDLRTSEEKIRNMQQMIHYFEIRKERRGIQAKISYEKAYSEGKDWPDPKEMEFYQAEKRLRMAPRAWDARVPKLHDRIESLALPEKPKGPEAGQ